MSADTAKDGIARDWRGTPIVPGALVIYGAPVGRSIALVEATVEGFTKSGRVNVRILRRAYGGGWTNAKDVVHVGADRLVVVNELPPTDMPLESEKIAENEARVQRRQDVENTHDFPQLYGTTVYVPWGERRCTKCLRKWNEVMPYEGDLIICPVASK